MRPILGAWAKVLTLRPTIATGGMEERAMVREARSEMPDDGTAEHPSAAGDRPLSRILRGLPEGGGLPLGGLMARMGSRAHGTALLLLALPEAIPIPVPSASTILGWPLVIVSAHLAAVGEGSRLPHRVERWSVPEALLNVVRQRLAPVLERAERLSRPRWERIAGREQLIGLVCLHLSLILLLPLPLVNTPPALCIALLAWGMIQRDGTFVVAGIIGTVLLTAALGAAGLWLAARIS
jgi:hypothetical protein